MKKSPCFSSINLAEVICELKKQILIFQGNSFGKTHPALY